MCGPFQNGFVAEAPVHGPPTANGPTFLLRAHGAGTPGPKVRPARGADLTFHGVTLRSDQFALTPRRPTEPADLHQGGFDRIRETPASPKWRDISPTFGSTLRNQIRFALSRPPAFDGAPDSGRGPRLGSTSPCEADDVPEE